MQHLKTNKQTNTMKKILLSLTFIALILTAKAQNASVEKSTFGIQTGLLGVWVHNELKLNNQFALRSEIGFNSEIFGGNSYSGTGFLLTPGIFLEPRWYYNLNKRVSKSRNIAGNSGNFVSIKTSFHPDWFVISNYDNVKVLNQITFIPTWGIRRCLGKHFTYETGIGIGYRYVFDDNLGYERGGGEAALNLHLRIGFRL